tara:strand:- start:1654 stop:2532 length:879 start_codon:yes stop_codon:yes gene_type:complete
VTIKDNNIGVIGLGNMGRPIAEHLANGGFEVFAYDTDNEKLDTQGVWVSCKSIQEIQRSASTVLLSLPDSDAVSAVVSQLISGSPLNEFTVIDTSTIGPQNSASIAAALKPHKGLYLDSPVSGGVRGAKAGSLSIMCAGDNTLFQTVLRFLKTFTANQFYIGPNPGQAQVMKVLNNFLSATALAATSEAILYGVNQGLDIEQMCDVINVSTGVNSASRDKFPSQVVTGQYDAGFTNSLMLKDIELFLEGCEKSDTASVVANTIVNQWRSFNQTEPGVDATRIYEFTKHRVDS